MTQPASPLAAATSLPIAAASLLRPAHGDADLIGEIAAGLLAPAAHCSPKFFYDGLGSKLFEAICELPEYYPTRTEAAIFARHGADMAAAIGGGGTLIDLGAGNCAKAASLFPLLRPAQYVPVDISRDFLLDAVERLQQRFPQIAMTALGLDFSAGFALPASVRAERRLFFYPGSSIGNFTPEQAVAFLRGLRDNAGADGGLLIGVDLVKDSAVLDAAYDDALGVTAAFNLNLLRHLNRLIGADFDVTQWRHRAFYKADAGRIEMHLEARAAQTVHWQGGSRRFAEGERIHTEDSYKYTRQGFVDLLQRAGFASRAVWTDPAGWFAVIHADVIAD
ncbi:L-histidine N(alpha)-methyltransferase [Rugamonas sp. CCM 8940]|nr:L-histidine N(alpha)-methyltransferase [Rugamonas sp. CCM 8940]